MEPEDHADRTPFYLPNKKLKSVLEEKGSITRHPHTQRLARESLYPPSHFTCLEEQYELDWPNCWFRVCLRPSLSLIYAFS